MRVYNFSAGPSMLPLEVLQEAGRQITDYEGSGMSVMELSHRGKVYEPIHNECIALIRELMNISNEYDVLLVQGGASTQFEAVPLNLLKKGRADYVVTGNFSKKAYKEAGKYGDIRLVASSEDKNFTYIPKVTRADFRDDIDYVHITENNTIFGTKWHYLPDCGANLVSDMSSGTEENRYDIRQTLHYVGVPLRARYSFWKPGGFDLYMTAGGKVEKCVGGTTSTSYVVKSSVSSSTKDRITVDPLQWSVGASLGIGYRFNDLVGIYLEPGVSYYFDNGSFVETVYRERPLNFSLGIGLRFNLN